MYSYYALALMKVTCPWKRYLTQAQLLQFTSVVIYTIATAYQHYYYLPHEAIEGEQPSLRTYYFCCIVQVLEMVSLFVLFSLFYKRSYSQRNKLQQERTSSSSSTTTTNSSTTKESSSEDQCYKAMGEISVAAKEVAGHAAKDAGKLVATATKVVKRNGSKSRVGAM
jgi:hypothetical protein